MPAANAMSGRGRGGECHARPGRCRHGDCASDCYRLLPIFGRHSDVRETKGGMISSDSSGHCEENAIAARIKGDRSAVNAICPARRVMVPAIAPTMIAAIDPEPP